jgi:hypothetical protein
LTLSYRTHYGPEIDSASNRNEYQECFLRSKGGRCIGLTNLPPSCDDCLEVWEPQPPGTLRACPGLQWDCFIFFKQTRKQFSFGRNFIHKYTRHSVNCQNNVVPFRAYCLIFCFSFNTFVFVY